MSSIEVSLKHQRDGFLLDASFNIPSQGITALFGQSGSGKTTVLRCIAGLEKPEQGLIKVAGDIWQNEHRFLAAHQRSAGFVFQSSNLFEHLNVADNLSYGYKRTPKNQQMFTIEKIIELLKLGELLNKKPQQLSGGQAQKVAIGRALLASPKLLLLDEPLASLDLASKAEILPLLEQVNQSLNIPIIYVSHSPDEIVRIANFLVLLNEGSVQAQGEVNKLLTQTDLPLAYLDEASAVLNGNVTCHDKRYHLTQLDIHGELVTVPLKEIAIGTNVRVRILSRDVSLTLQRPEKTSINNILAVSIHSINPGRDPSKVVVKLCLGDDYLLAQITHRSVDTLELTPGLNVYAQVKSVALMH